jgi:hypothetical protein
MISPLDPGLRLIKIPIIAQDVGRAHDRSTAMIGGAVLVYNVGRTFLLELLLAEFRNQYIRLPDSPEARRALCATHGPRTGTARNR